MVERLGLSGDVQYDWSLDDARISWSREGKVFLTGQLAMIGSASPSSPGCDPGRTSHCRTQPWATSTRSGSSARRTTTPSFRGQASTTTPNSSPKPTEPLWTDSIDDVQLHFLVHDLDLITAWRDGTLAPELLNAARRTSNVSFNCAARTRDAPLTPPACSYSESATP